MRTILGQVVRDVERKVDQIANPRVQQLVESHLESELGLAKRVMAQERTSKNKVYSAHAPEVECISKGKVHKRYEFGVKVGIAVTNRSNSVLGGLAFPGNPYDGHTLSTQLGQVERITGTKPEEVFVDRGYRGHGFTGFHFRSKARHECTAEASAQATTGGRAGDRAHQVRRTAGAELPERHRRRPDECDAELCGAQHANNPEEDQDFYAVFLWRLFSCFGPEKQCYYSLSGNIVNLPENSLKQGFSGPTTCRNRTSRRRIRLSSYAGSTLPDKPPESNTSVSIQKTCFILPLLLNTDKIICEFNTYVT